MEIEVDIRGDLSTALDLSEFRDFVNHVFGQHLLPEEVKVDTETSYKVQVRGTFEL